ncbi:MAG: ABC transporter ATP-binding protein [Candidatus Melainabacteria bacterium]|nr:ABC transporter ATP-binding protein [Candidatus Melainabacteria bacterium]
MADVVIQTTNLSKELTSSLLRRKVRILSGLNLSVAKGETFGLIGPNGAGKTTSIKLMLGLMRATEGKAEILGMPAGDKRALAQVGYLPENPYFYSHLTGREFLDFAGQLFGLGSRERKDRSKELIETVSLAEAADMQMRKYSKGMLQRLGIAQSLINRPAVIFWDEPMSGLDPIGRRDIRQILFGLKEKGTTIFFNSHLLPDVNEVCDRVGVINKGRLIVQEEVKNISAGGSYKDLEDFFLEVINKSESESNARTDQMAAITPEKEAAKPVKSEEEAKP